MNSTATVGGEPPGVARTARYLAGWLAGALPALAMIALLWLYPGPATPFGIVGLGAYALAFPVMVRRLSVPRSGEFLTFLVLAGIAFAVLSILTGWGNGLTDEGFTTPRFAGFLLGGHDPYTSPMTIAYSAYGQHFVSTSYYVYLPALMFLQVPGVAYKWFSLACWVALVVLVRRRFDIAVLLAQPYAMIVAENGYNDLVILLLLSIAYVGIEGRRSRWAEWVALGCKQFANVFVLLYYAVRRDWRNVLVTAGVTVVFIVPFYLWSGPAVLCPTLLANRPAFCPHTGGIQLLINYPIWLVWVVAVFYAPALAAVHGIVARRGRSGPGARGVLAPGRFERLPSVLVVGASAAITGLGAFVLGTALWGFRPAGALLAAAVALGPTVAWGYVWGGPWTFEALVGPARRAAIRYFAVSQGVLASVALALMAGVLAVGGPPIVGAMLGLGVGAAAGYGLLVAWNAPAPVGSRAAVATDA